MKRSPLLEPDLRAVRTVVLSSAQVSVPCALCTEYLDLTSLPCRDPTRNRNCALPNLNKQYCSSSLTCHVGRPYEHSLSTQLAQKTNTSILPLLLSRPTLKPITSCRAVLHCSSSSQPAHLLQHHESQSFSLLLVTEHATSTLSCRVRGKSTLLLASR